MKPTAILLTLIALWMLWPRDTLNLMREMEGQ